MATLFTLDASVFVAACRPREPGHTDSRALLQAVRQAETPLIEPAILPVEIAAALSRTGDDPASARDYAEAVMALPGLTLLSLDERLARRALALAATHKLRGADALYAAAAAQYGARLVSLDTEQLKRAPAAVAACAPGAALGVMS